MSTSTRTSFPFAGTALPACEMREMSEVGEMRAIGGTEGGRQEVYRLKGGKDHATRLLL